MTTFASRLTDEGFERPEVKQWTPTKTPDG